MENKEVGKLLPGQSQDPDFFTRLPEKLLVCCPCWSAYLQSANSCENIRESSWKGPRQHPSLRFFIMPSKVIPLARMNKRQSKAGRANDCDAAKNASSNLGENSLPNGNCSILGNVSRNPGETYSLIS